MYTDSKTDTHLTNAHTQSNTKGADMTTNRTAPINFHPGNLALYAKRALYLADETPITYEYGLPHYVYGPGPADGRYWKYVIYETRDALDLCAWLNAHGTHLPAALAPESNTEAAQQCADELEQADEPWEPDDPDGSDLEGERLEQCDFFAARVDDLPLFSGTAPRATVTPFVETEPQPTTPRLF